MENIILAATARHDELIRILGETDFASSAVNQSTAYIKELQSQIATEENNLKVLSHKLQKEQSEHEAYRDSRVKRLAYKLSGQKEKFIARAEKEELEYHDALQGKFQAERKLQMLKGSLGELKTSKLEYERINGRHEKAQVELDALYDSIFSGSTPEFPQEDVAEERVKQAQNVYNNVSGRLHTEAQVAKLLSDAAKAINLALQDTSDAMSAARLDLWGGGSLLTHYAERDSLSLAQSQASNAEMLMNMARNLQPLIQPIRVQIAQPDFLSNVLFDNIFTDLLIRDEIVASEVDLNKARVSISSQQQAAGNRFEALKGKSKRMEQDLQTARRNLRKTRQEAFQSIVPGSRSTSTGVAVDSPSHTEQAGLLPNVPPPAYLESDPPAYNA